MAPTNKFIDFLKIEQINCEKKLKDTYDVVPENRESRQTACHEKLAVIYKYLNEEEKSKRMLRYLTTYCVSTSRFDVEGFLEEDKKNTRLLCSTGRLQLKEGIRFNLAKTDPQKARQIFE